MKRAKRASGLLFLLMIACGGSSSETPMPLEPVPHSGPEPVVSSQKKTPAPLEDAEENSSDQDSDVVAPDEDAAEAPTRVAPQEGSSAVPGEAEADEPEAPTTLGADE